MQTGQEDYRPGRDARLILIVDQCEVRGKWEVAGRWEKFPNPTHSWWLGEDGLTKIMEKIRKFSRICLPEGGIAR